MRRRLVLTGARLARLARAAAARLDFVVMRFFLSALTFLALIFLVLAFVTLVFFALAFCLLRVLETFAAFEAFALRPPAFTVLLARAALCLPLAALCLTVLRCVFELDRMLVRRDGARDAALRCLLERAGDDERRDGADDLRETPDGR